MAPDPRRERYEPSSRPCSTSWKFGPSPRKTVIASPSSRRTSSSPISTVPESSRYRAGLTMKVNLRPWNFRMTPLLVSVSSCASSCNSNCRATESNSSLLGSTSEIHTTARRSRTRDLPVLQRRRGREACDLQYIPFAEGLPLKQSLGTQYGEATSNSVRYPRYDQRLVRGAR